MTVEEQSDLRKENPNVRILASGTEETMMRLMELRDSGNSVFQHHVDQILANLAKDNGIPYQRVTKDFDLKRIMKHYWGGFKRGFE